MYHGNLVAQMLAALSPTAPPVIWNVRGSHSDLRQEKPRTALAIWLGARLSSLPCRIVNNSEASAELHEQRLRFASDRWEIIPNGFDLTRFGPCDAARRTVRDELSIPEDAPLIGLIGRCHPMKDHANFIRAAGLLVKTVPEAHFLLAGHGADTSNAVLTGQIREAGVAHRVHLLGARIDIARVTAALDIATSASYSEGFPNAIGEAMCCAVPCVVTDVGASASLVGSAGIVIPPRNTRALADAWRDLIALGAEARRKLGRTGRERIAAHFSVKSISKQYEELYQWAAQLKTGENSGKRQRRVRPRAASPSGTFREDQ
jgi:glycosyltransferase involved in cell wall biosynthesis